MTAASIRTKNPGAMWPGKIPTKWGSTKWVYLSDGTGQGGGGHGNKIAFFDTFEAGCCAQLDLWRSSANYRNKKFKDAISVWSGGNHVASYIKFVTDRVPGMTADTVMNDTFWKGPLAIGFLKAQAWHEAGTRYPAADMDFINAQKRVMGGILPTKNTVIKGATSVATGTASGTLAGVQGGLSLPTALIIGLVIALAVFLVWKFKPEKAEAHLPAVPITPPAPDNISAPVATPAPDSLTRTP